MRKVSPCPVCQMEFSSYKESQIHFKTEHREWQRVIWRTQNNIRQRRRLDQRLQQMKDNDKVSKKIIRQHPAFGQPNGLKICSEMKDSEEQVVLVQAPIPYIKRLHGRRRCECEGGGILKIRRNVTLPGFGSRGPIKNQ